MEFATALLLLPAASAWFGGALALGLLLLFSCAIAFHLSRGRAPDCNCFGQIFKAPVGTSTLWRNAVFALMAVGVLFPPEMPIALGVRDMLEVSFAIIVMASLIALGFLIFQLVRQQGRVILAIEALSDARPAEISTGAAPPRGIIAAGHRAPHFTLLDSERRERSLGDMLEPGRPVLLLLTNPHCGPCEALLPELSGWHQTHRDCVNIVVAMEQKKNEESSIPTQGTLPIMRQREREVSLAYGAAGTPAAVLIHPDGTLGSSLAMGADAIRVLFVNARHNACIELPSRPSSKRLTSGHLSLGQAVPNIELEDVNGGSVQLYELIGRPIVILFWSARCGYCIRMQDELFAWENRSNSGQVVLVVVAAGDRESYLHWPLRALLLLDRQGRAAAQFGATGTPSAILIDIQGRVASLLEAGAQAVLTLLDRARNSAPAQ